MTRFRDWGTLRYLLRGIQFNAPFIGKVHLVVSDQDQVPAWLSRRNVNVVAHKDIIPETYLPTFNTNTIELWLHRIPGLSECFLNFNDDVFLLSPCREEDFFVRGRPVLNPRKLTECVNMFRMFLRNSTALARELLNVPDESWFMMQRHTVAPMTRASYEFAYRNAGDRIARSFTKVRSQENLNDYLFMDINRLSGKYHPGKIDFKYFGLAKENLDAICEHVELSQTKTLCLNDGCEAKDFTEVRGRVLESFEKRFPKKSKYEL